MIMKGVECTHGVFYVTNNCNFALKHIYSTAKAGYKFYFSGDLFSVYIGCTYFVLFVGLLLETERSTIVY